MGGLTKPIPPGTITGDQMQDDTVTGQQVDESTLSGVPVETHETTHRKDQSDELLIDQMGTTNMDSDKVLKPSGSGGVQWVDDETGNDEKVKASSDDPTPDYLDGKTDGSTIQVSASEKLEVIDSPKLEGSTRGQVRAHGHSLLTGVGADDHHAQLHQASHQKGQADALLIDGQGTSETGTTKRLAPDGSNGVTWVESTDQDEKVKASATDPTPGYLNGKVDALTIDVVSEKLQVQDSPTLEGNDTTAVRNHAPQAHKTSHESGGSDELDLTDMTGLLATAQTPAAHKTSHEDGGADEISIAGLSGEAADPQTPKTHASSHQDGGADEIDVGGLSGELADPQPPKTHASSHAEDAADELLVEDLGTGSSTAGQVAQADGSGGLDMVTLEVEQKIVFMGYAANIGGNQSGYITINDGETKLSGVEAYNQLQMPACSVKAIKGQALSTGNITFTVRKNGANTGITGQLTTSGDFSITGSGEVSFSAGDKISLAFSCPPAGGMIVAGIQIVYDQEVI